MTTLSSYQSLFAQTWSGSVIPANAWVSGSITNTLPPELQWNNEVLENAEAIGSVEIDFCSNSENQRKNDKSELVISTEWWMREELCFRLKNIGSKTIRFGVNFVDGLYNNMSNKSCDLETKKEKVWQYITWYEESIVLQPWQVLDIKPYLEFPKGLVWKKLACLTLRPWSETKLWTWDWSNKWGVKIIPRRWVPIEIFSKWILTRWIGISSSGVKLNGEDILDSKNILIGEWNNWDIDLWYYVSNVGLLEEKVVISGYITDLFWNKFDLKSHTKTLTAWRSEIIKETIDMPWYDMRFTIHLSATSDANLDWIDPQYIQWEKGTISLSIQENFFIFPRRLVIAIIAIICTRYVYDKIKKKYEERKKAKQKEQEEFLKRKENTAK